MFQKTRPCCMAGPVSLFNRLRDLPLDLDRRCTHGDALVPITKYVSMFRFIHTLAAKSTIYVHYTVG